MVQGQANACCVHPDALVTADAWSDLSRQRPPPDIDHDRLHRYRLERIRAELERLDLDMVLIHNPVSLRYALNYRTYSLFQSRTPTTYCFVAQDGPTVAFQAYGDVPVADEIRTGHALCYFDGGDAMAEASQRIADDVVRYLDQIGAGRRRVGLEYINPSVTCALLDRGVDVIDGVGVTEHARLIKSEDEIACIRWAIAVAEHAIAKVDEAIRPGVSELQLWALLSYVNLANDGDWHEGRMLASGPRTNPWLQEASSRKIQAGDLVAFDTDMVGPHGYFADISRTVYCGPGSPTERQRELYRMAVAEIEHNLTLVRAGAALRDVQKKAYVKPEEFHELDYPCIMHAVGMCDEYPRIDPIHRGENRYDDVLHAGMVMCIESYVGAVGETDGVKLEQQVLVTDDGYEMLTTYPYDERLLG